jgi:hypothetical protein
MHDRALEFLRLELELESFHARFPTGKMGWGTNFVGFGYLGGHAMKVGEIDVSKCELVCHVSWKTLMNSDRFSFWIRFQICH